MFKNCHNCRYQPLLQSKEHCLFLNAFDGFVQVRDHGLLGTCEYWKEVIEIPTNKNEIK